MNKAQVLLWIHWIACRKRTPVLFIRFIKLIVKDLSCLEYFFFVLFIERLLGNKINHHIATSGQTGI